MQLLLFLVGFILFVSLVLVHEWGHFIMARRSGVVVEEFGLGFPPRAKGRKLKSGMILSVNWLPLGGFVKMRGEHTSDTKKGSFGAAPMSAKVKIMLAGVTMNLITGLVLLTILALAGMPKLIDNQFTVKSDTKVSRQEVRVGYIEPNSPAAKAGLDSNDIIKSVTGQSKCGSSSCRQTRSINTSENLHDATLAFGGQAVQLNYKRGSKDVQKTVQLRSPSEVNASLKTDNPKGYLGISPAELEMRRSTWSAPVVAVGFTGQLIWLTLQGLGHAVAGLGSAIAGLVTNNHAARLNGTTAATDQTGGIVAIMDILWQGGSLGLSFTLMIIAVISLSLAIMNILPIPALDGGRLFVMLVYRAIRRPLSQRREDSIHGTGMAVLLFLFALITIVDVKRFF